MKRNNFIKITLLCFGLIVINSSCKKWLDKNTSPNELSDDQAKIEYNLTSAQYTIAYVLGNKYQEIGGFLAQYWTQLASATQYYDYDRYSFDSQDGDREWRQFYAGALRDLKYVVDKGTADGDSNYVAIAKFLQAYTYQLIADVHGDIPFKEALEAQNGVLTPTYDAQSEVYNGCLILINDGLKLISGEARVPGSEDAIYHGDMDLWEQFANTLKLKLAIRQSKVRPTVANDILTDLSGASFIDVDHDAKVPFYDVINNRNPLFASIQGLGVDNNVASSTIIDTLVGWGDARTPFFFNQHNNTFYAGTPQGIAAAAIGYPSNSPKSTLASTILGSTVPVILISAAESYFLQAEAKTHPNLGAGNGRAEYEMGVTASILYAGLDTTGITALFEEKPYSWDSTTNHLELIGVQKWVALCGTQNMESWIEVRRSGYPVQTPSQASTLGAGLIPARIPYPASEETSNSNFPGQKAITSKLWWAN